MKRLKEAESNPLVAGECVESLVSCDGSSDASVGAVIIAKAALWIVAIGESFSE